MGRGHRCGLTHRGRAVRTSDEGDFWGDDVLRVETSGVQSGVFFSLRSGNGALPRFHLYDYSQLPTSPPHLRKPRINIPLLGLPLPQFHHATSGYRLQTQICFQREILMETPSYKTARVIVSPSVASQDVKRPLAHILSGLCSWADCMYLPGGTPSHPHVCFVGFFTDEGNLWESSHRVGGSESHFLDCWTSTCNYQPGTKSHRPAFTHHHEQPS